MYYQILYILLLFHYLSLSLAAEINWQAIAEDHLTTEDVLTYGLGLNAQRFTPLKQINQKTVSQLVPAWAFAFGHHQARGEESQPLVHEGIIYVTAAGSRLFAVDARTGEEIWEYNYDLPDGIMPCCGLVNRGAAVYADKVFFGTLDAGIVALNRKTGKVVWKQNFDNHHQGYSLTAAPLIVKDTDNQQILLIHGNSGGEFGIVGKVYARDPETGREIWMRPTIEGMYGRLNGKPSTPSGDAEHPTWPHKQRWKNGGGAPWLTASFDSTRQLIIIGSGNPAPWNGWVRGGDSLYTSSQLAIDPGEGEIIWHYQHTPNDTWDFSGNNEFILFDYLQREETIPATAHADKNGFFYIVDRRNGKLLLAEPFVKGINWAQKIDLTTGRPVENPEKRPPLPASGQHKGKSVFISPPFLGAKSWSPMAYSQQTGWFYIPANEWAMDMWSELPVDYAAGFAYLGMGFKLKRLFKEHIGVLKAFDPQQGTVVWAHHEPYPLWSGVLATAGNLVFFGTLDGYLKALDAQTGQVLWKFQTGSGIVAPPISWEMAGEQYISVVSGIGGAVSFWGPTLVKSMRNFNAGSMLWTFKLHTLENN